MDNKNKYLITEIIRGIGKETLVLEYLPERTDPKFDDLPSEQLQPGDLYYLTFTPVEKKPEDDFNRG